MTMPRLAARRLEENSCTADISRIQSLVRKLLLGVGAPCKSTGTSEAEQTVLDIELDGARYQLIRRPCRAIVRHSLSPREMEIARLVAKGYVNKTIAGILDISCYTVDTYLRRVFAKLDVTSRSAMVARLSAEGLLADGPLDFQ